MRYAMLELCACIAVCYRLGQRLAEAAAHGFVGLPFFLADGYVRREIDIGPLLLLLTVRIWSVQIGLKRAGNDIHERKELVVADFGRGASDSFELPLQLTRWCMVIESQESKEMHDVRVVKAAFLLEPLE